MNKAVYFILLFANYIFSQTGTLKGKILEQNHGFPGVTVVLTDKDSKTYGTQTDMEGNYKIENLQIGVYTLKITYIGAKDKIYESFEIGPNEREFILNYSEPCPKSIKICPKNHKDNIIPILYGMPGKKMMEKSKKGKIKLGGCDPSLCEKWHCKTHNISF